MKLKFEIEVTDAGVACSGTYEGLDAYENQTANIMAIGALEIARSSLLAQRWGLRHQPPIVPASCKVDEEGA